jgi:streptogramin lyase
VDVWLGKLAVVTTLAGGTSGSANGTGAAAQFNGPFGVTVLPNGNIAVGDTFNKLIRLVTPAGVVTTLAGDGTAALLDGTGTGAKFNFPFGVGALPNGNVVVADRENNCIRMITPAGVVTTIAGSPNRRTLADGAGLTEAAFNEPQGVAGLPNGNIVVADRLNQRVRLITMPSGVVSTFPIVFGALWGVGALPNGNIIVVDTTNNAIKMITMPDGVISTIAGGTSGSADGPGASAQFSLPSGVAVLPNGNIVVADSNNNRIRLITMPSGVVSTLAGDGTYATLNGTGTAARFSTPNGVAVLLSGSIVVTDQGGNAIRLITPT